ncbi:tRNA-binding protein [Spiroplasma poulsonii]|uniref:tRNA-binding protein n=1 Tax=Spiroplasma poulsonii TaxID=2138 RepID=A0A3S0UB42_9MOLU|nr:tRNA-binding protein [Spiroplasma poulsonii]MBW3057883.1 tRNA-binding protein [Spiroplasma poulsonii]RUP76650.1 tRNA-binding protein [Spiroplasma poulsonii]
METKSIGLFYHPVFDVLVGYEPTVTQGEHIIKKEWVFFHDESKQCYGFNLLNASQHLTTKLKPGINSDNKLLLTELSTNFKKQGGLFHNINNRPQFIVGQILERKQHPNSDKLNICQVTIGSEVLQIICGADNCDVGQLVVVARVGAIMPSTLQIIPSELRGIMSNGMLCSEQELGLPVSSVGKKIVLLSPKQYHLGSSFWKEYYNEQN